MNARLLTIAAAGLLVAGIAAPAPAQDYPTQTIKMIISFGPAAAPTSSAASSRSACRRSSASRSWWRTGAGAGGMLGNEAVANSPKDGYTLGVMTAGQIIAPVMTKAPRYDTLKAFDSVGQIATAGLADRDAAGLSRTRTSRSWSPPPRPIPARSCSRARATARPSISPPNCSSRWPASTRCRCSSAPRPRRSRRCSPRTSTCCSTP